VKAASTPRVEDAANAEQQGVVQGRELAGERGRSSSNSSGVLGPGGEIGAFIGIAVATRSKSWVRSTCG